MRGCGMWDGAVVRIWEGEQRELSIELVNWRISWDGQLGKKPSSLESLRLIDSEEGKKRGWEKEQGRELEMCKAGRVKERGERREERGERREERGERGERGDKRGKIERMSAHHEDNQREKQK
jgi:hypothetical protein